MLVGVLGGLTPEATAFFAKRIRESTAVSRDQDHIRLLVSSDPEIPDRSDAILGDGVSPERTLVEHAKRLDSAGCDVIVAPESLVHHYYDVITVSVDADVVSLVEIVDETVQERGFESLYVLGTEALSTAGVYDGLTADVVYPTDFGPVTNSVYSQKVGAEGRAVEQYAEATEDVPSGVDGLLVAHAALSSLSWPTQQPSVDAMELLVEYVVTTLGTGDT